MTALPAQRHRSAFERTAALERRLIRLRWFAAAFGLFQMWSAADTPAVPDLTLTLSYLTVATLAVGNALVSLGVRRAEDVNALRRLGLSAFALDAAVIFASAWLYSYDRNSTVWVVIYVLPLEGAIRYQLGGALASVGLAFVSEIGRELYRVGIFADLQFEITGVTFRVGILAFIAGVAGLMSRGLERERDQAEARAAELAALAERESVARAELQALHDVLLAGVSAPGLREALQSMVDRIGTGLGYASLTVLLLEEDGRLHPAASHGLPEPVMSLSMALGEGIYGAVAASGKPEIIPDVSEDPRYFEVDPRARSGAVVPIIVGGEVAGVLSAESHVLDAFDEGDRARLERLAAYMALVIENARLLGRERATVGRLRELDAIKSDFIAVASHELRTPLTAIHGFIKTLRRSDVTVPPHEREEFLAIIDQQAERLGRLVEDLLVTARIDSGVLDVRLDSVDVAQVLEETVHEFGPAGGRVQLAVDPGLPPAVTDGQYLGRIARNLIANALKFSPDDAPVLVTAAVDGGRLRLDVSDQGPGVSPEELPEIFERFHQVGGSLRRRGEGLGLGLYITKHLVEGMKGTIEVCSSPGRGTTFQVRLPMAPAEGTAAHPR